MWASVCLFSVLRGGVKECMQRGVSRCVFPGVCAVRASCMRSMCQKVGEKDRAHPCALDSSKFHEGG